MDKKYYCPHTEDYRPPCPENCPMLGTQVCVMKHVSDTTLHFVEKIIANSKYGYYGSIKQAFIDNKAIMPKNTNIKTEIYKK